MKGNLVHLIACLTWLPAFHAQTNLVLNEVNLVTGPNYGQFIELYGTPNLTLDGHAVVIVKSLPSGAGGEWTGITQAALSLDGMALDEEGFISIDGSGWQNTICAVALTEDSATLYPINEVFSMGNVLDVVFYGNTSSGSVQGTSLYEAFGLTPPSESVVFLNEGFGADQGVDGLSRLPDGGEGWDQQFIVQALSPGTTNVLACEGGTLTLNNPDITTFCTDLGPAVVGFTHTTDATNDETTLVVVDANDAVVGTFQGTSINMQGLADGTFMVYAISHSGDLTDGWETLNDVDGVSEDVCWAWAEGPVMVQGLTCEVPSCDGGVLLTAGAEEDAQACLTEDGALVSFGYYSDAVEDEYVFLICDANDTILATTNQPYFDFATFGEAGDYHVWGFSYQDGLDTASIGTGAWGPGASASGCDSLSANFLPVQILQCGAAGLCEDLIISEYVEGTSQNKAIEIHNPTPFEVDLTPYFVERFNNGATTANETLDLQGVLAPGGVHVIANPEAAAPIIAQQNVISTVTWFNGNDVVALRKNDEIIDMMGVIGDDPGEELGWQVGEGAMKEYTLVRKPNIGEGTTNWNEGQTQWDVYPQDTFNFLGEHTASCGGLGTMVVGFDNPELYVSEGSGVTISMNVSYPLENTTVQVSVTGGDATVGSDFPDVFPLSFEFPAGLLNSQSFTFAAVDDEDPELQEDVELTLTFLSDSTGAVLGIESTTIHILPSDLEYPVYDIIQVRGVDNQGILDSIDTACELRGIVYGWNDYPQALRFTLMDETSGINVLSPVAGTNFGYQVQEGDSVRVRGVIQQSAGLARINIDTLIYEGSGYPTMDPILVSGIDEETESRLVKLKCVTLDDPSQWTNSGPYFDVLVNYGLGAVKLRIDANTDIYGTEAPIGSFGVSGIGGQSDDSQPYLDSYTLLPRSMEDLTEPVLAAFSVPSSIDVGGDPVTAINQSQGAVSYLWSFGNGAFSQEETPILPYTEEGTYNIFLTAGSADGLCSNQTSATIEVVALDNLSDMDIQVGMYPNPAVDELVVSVNAPIAWRVLDGSGRVCASGSWKAGRNVIDVSSWPSGMYSFVAENASDPGLGVVHRFGVLRQ